MAKRTTIIWNLCGFTQLHFDGCSMRGHGLTICSILDLYTVPVHVLNATLCKLIPTHGTCLTQCRATETPIIQSRHFNLNIRTCMEETSWGNILKMRKSCTQHTQKIQTSGRGIAKCTHDVKQRSLTKLYAKNMHILSCRYLISTWCQYLLGLWLYEYKHPPNMLNFKVRYNKTSQRLRLYCLDKDRRPLPCNHNYQETYTDILNIGVASRPNFKWFPD